MVVHCIEYMMLIVWWDFNKAGQKEKEIKEESRTGNNSYKEKAKSDESEPKQKIKKTREVHAAG